MYTHLIWEELKIKAKKKKVKIVLPEASDERVLKAAGILTTNELARICVIGDEKIIEQKCKTFGFNSKKIECINPAASSYTQKIAEHIFERRKSKGMQESEAAELAHEELYFGFGMLALGQADAAVAGAVHTTADTVRSAMYCLGTAPGSKIIIGIFLVETPHAKYHGLGGSFVFADCGVTPEPSARMLARIGKQAAEAFSFYYHKDPRIAFLSFSTLGSASHARVDRIKEAVDIAKKQFPDLNVEGELQLDAALDASIAYRKGVAKSSSVAGGANVLIFPDLDSGNITYKAVQHLGNARAIGPILWGMQKPVSDLSRGCSVDDIVYSALAVSAQC
ncbi:MAG: phosphate acetyltransferase [bacterium]